MNGILMGYEVVLDNLRRTMGFNNGKNDSRV